MGKSVGGPDGRAKRDRHRRSGVLSLLVVAAVVMASFGAGLPMVSPIAHVIAAAGPNPGPGGSDSDSPAPRPPKSNPSPSEGGSTPDPVKSPKPAEADTGRGDAAAVEEPKAAPPQVAPQVESATPTQPEPAAQVDTGRPKPVPAAGQVTDRQGANVADPKPGQLGGQTPTKPSKTPQTGAVPPVPVGVAPRPDELTQQGGTPPAPAAGAEQLVPLGTTLVKPAETNTAVQDALKPGAVKSAAFTFDTQTVQTCMGGSLCRATPASLTTEPTAAMPPRKEVFPLIGLGLGAGEAAAVTGAVAAGLVATYHFMANGVSGTVKSLLGDEEVSHIVDPASPAPPNAAKPGDQSSELGSSAPVSPRPLETDPSQIEKKYKHAPDFGVSKSRGREGFDEFEKALKDFVEHPDTIHNENGTYRKDPAILHYNPESGLVVVQKPDGAFVSGWKMTEKQLKYVENGGDLGGG